MPLRLITAPGVQINEIDRSGYTTVPTGTAVYLKGFTSKGEPYRPFEITTRTAYEQMYGAPDSEAERYTYAAACETLNQGGRLWMARLPYDNESFQKMPGIKYTVQFKNDISALSDQFGEITQQLSDMADIKKAFLIKQASTPVVYSLSSIDAYREDEEKVPPDTFLIVDTTGGTYGKVMEGERKGEKREVVGIVPVVTTAANALYAQSLLDVGLSNIHNYESLKAEKLSTLVEGNHQTSGLMSSDVVIPFSTEGYFTIISSEQNLSTAVIGDWSNSLSTKDAAEISCQTLSNNWNSSLSTVVGDIYISDSIEIVDIVLQDTSAAISVVPSTLDTISDIQKATGIALAYYGETMPLNSIADIVKAVSWLDTEYGTTEISDLGNELTDAFNSLSITTANDSSEDPDKNTTPLAAESGEGEGTTKNSPTSEGNNTTENTQTSEGEKTQIKTIGDIKKCLEEWFNSNSGASYKPVWYAIIRYQTKVSSPYYESTEVPQTQSLDASQYFPTIQMALGDDGNNVLDTEHMKDIGVVVYKMYVDPTEGNKVSYEAVEAYAGSLYKNDVNPTTGVTKFIDTIINSQSKYINFFSNCFASTNSKNNYLDKCDILLVEPTCGASLGFYSSMTTKDISISKSILGGMNICFDKVADVNKLDIDIVPDAGLANIASYLKAIWGDKGPYDLSITDDVGNSLLGMWSFKRSSDAPVKMWKTIEMKHDNFCKNIRKDCMFIADGLRPLVIQGQKKTIRDSKPSNSIDKDILPYVQAICGLNTSYGAGYIDWFEQADDYTGDFFWCPPSIKAMGVYINTDLNFEYWDAPAGLNRGIIAATDVAFSPNGKQAGSIYEKCWNYAINYPQDGIVLEGQKTFQTKPSALDRVNVRRTMLRLERQVYKTLRYFVYEGNTAYTRQRVVDAIEPIMKACWKSGNGGLQRYKIVCDDKINDANTIDNNELKVQIGVVPTKTAEFILVDFVLGNQSSTWAELLG